MPTTSSNPHQNARKAINAAFAAVVGNVTDIPVKPIGIKEWNTVADQYWHEKLEALFKKNEPVLKAKYKMKSINAAFKKACRAAMEDITLQSDKLLTLIPKPIDNDNKWRWNGVTGWTEDKANAHWAHSWWKLAMQNLIDKAKADIESPPRKRKRDIEDEGAAEPGTEKDDADNAAAAGNEDDGVEALPGQGDQDEVQDDTRTSEDEQEEDDNLPRASRDELAIISRLVTGLKRMNEQRYWPVDNYKSRFTIDGAKILVKAFSHWAGMEDLQSFPHLPVVPAMVRLHNYAPLTVHAEKWVNLENEADISLPWSVLANYASYGLLGDYLPLFAREVMNTCRTRHSHTIDIPPEVMFDLDATYWHSGRGQGTMNGDKVDIPSAIYLTRTSPTMLRTRLHLRADSDGRYILFRLHTSGFVWRGDFECTLEVFHSGDYPEQTVKELCNSALPPEFGQFPIIPRQFDVITAPEDYERYILYLTLYVAGSKFDLSSPLPSTDSLKSTAQLARLIDSCIWDGTIIDQVQNYFQEFSKCFTRTRHFVNPLDPMVVPAAKVKLQVNTESQTRWLSPEKPAQQRPLFLVSTFRSSWEIKGDMLDHVFGVEIPTNADVWAKYHYSEDVTQRPIEIIPSGANNFMYRPRDTHDRVELDINNTEAVISFLQECERTRRLYYVMMCSVLASADTAYFLIPELEGDVQRPGVHTYQHCHLFVQKLCDIANQATAEGLLQNRSSVVFTGGGLDLLGHMSGDFKGFSRWRSLSMTWQPIIWKGSRTRMPVTVYNDINFLYVDVSRFAAVLEATSDTEDEDTWFTNNGDPNSSRLIYCGNDLLQLISEFGLIGDVKSTMGHGRVRNHSLPGAFLIGRAGKNVRTLRLAEKSPLAMSQIIRFCAVCGRSGIHFRTQYSWIAHPTLAGLWICGRRLCRKEVNPVNT